MFKVKTNMLSSILTLFLFCLSICHPASAVKNQWWHCINKKGKTLFSHKGKYVYEFNNQCAVIEKNILRNKKWVSKIGVIDKLGNIVFKFNFDKVKQYKVENKLIWVRNKTDKIWRLFNIETNCEISLSKKFDCKKYSGFIYKGQELLPVYLQGRLGFISISGKQIIPCNFEGGEKFVNGLLCVALKDKKGIIGKFGFIDKEGQQIIPYKYKQNGPSTFFSNGLCRVLKNGKTVLIDKTGTTKFMTNKGNIQSASKYGVLVLVKRKWGILGFDNKWLIKPIYDDLKNPIAKGVTVAKKGTKMGIIDISGKILLPFEFTSILFYPDRGFIRAKKPSSNNYEYYSPELRKIDVSTIGVNGAKQMSNYRASDLIRFQDPITRKFGYLDRNFKVVIPARFTEAHDFSEGLAWVRK